MRKVISYIIALCCLCFVFEAKAQQATVKVTALKDKLANLNENEANFKDQLMRQAVGVLTVSEQGVFFPENEEPVVMVFVDGWKNRRKLETLSADDVENQLGSTGILVIRLDDEEDSAPLAFADIALFPVLDYILLESYRDLEPNRVSLLVSALKNELPADSELEVLYRTLEVAQ